MAKREQISVNLRPEVRRWMRWLELHGPASSTMVATTSLVALRMMTKPEQKNTAKWAKLIDEEILTWADFEKICDKQQKDRDRILAERLAAALEHEPEESLALPAKKK